jgi:hypothetical protein
VEMTSCMLSYFVIQVGFFFNIILVTLKDILDFPVMFSIREESEPLKVGGRII